MPKNLINIRTDTFTKQEIKIIEDLLKEWDYTDIVEIDYLGEGSKDKLDVSFTIEKDDLGEFLGFIFACGYEFVYRG